MSERAGRKRAKIVEGRSRSWREWVRWGVMNYILATTIVNQFDTFLSTRIEKCASCENRRYELNSSLMKLKFWGKFNHNTIQLLLKFKLNQTFLSLNNHVFQYGQTFGTGRYLKVQFLK